MKDILKDQKIMIVDDDEMGAELLSRILSNHGAETKICTKAGEAIRSAIEFDPILVLLDFHLPVLSGLELLPDLKKACPNAAVVFLSGKQEAASIIAAFAAGGDDFISKPYQMEILTARLGSHVRQQNKINELQLTNEALTTLAERDDVTGLYNMRYMFQKIDDEIKRALRYGRDLAIVMLDIDFFKSVNDNHDHLFGSYVLREMGEIILDNLRHGIDFSARYGGDEFLIVLPETGYEGAGAFANRLRETLAKQIFKDKHNDYQLTVSMGYACPEGEKMSAEDLVLEADRALYCAKETGRNRVVGNKDEVHLQKVAS